MTLSRIMMSAAAALVAGTLAGEGRALAQDAAQSAAQTPPEGFSWYVLNELNGFYLDIEDPTNRPPLITEVPEGVIEPVDLNMDGRTDWLIRWPDSTRFCGTGGCRTTLYICGEDGFVRAFDRQALRFEIKVIDREQRVEATLHTVNCREGREECTRVWVWDAAAKRLRVVASSDGGENWNEPPPVEDAGQGAD
ncbi:hypothetical protein [Brevundimonas sp.]|uniref:hypothetical protein n=1 Tax=Brevundimonas sp. TaxID=1871086 RepID=UPI003F70C856